MRYALTENVAVELVPGRQSFFAQFPTWHLADWSIWVGNFGNGYELEALAGASRGSYEWYGDDVDTVLFSQETNELTTVALRVPEAIQVIEGHSFAAAGYHFTEGNLRLCAPGNFQLPPCDFSIYQKTADRLFLVLGSGPDDFEYDFAVELCLDLYILFNQQQFTGWMLKNASAHIPPAPAHNPATGDLTKTRYLLQYLAFFEEDKLAQLEDQDPAVKAELNSLQRALETEQDGSLAEINKAVSSLLDAYF